MLHRQVKWIFGSDPVCFATFSSPFHLPPTRIRRTMSSSQQTPWSNNPNAPKIPYHLYIQEKAYLVGALVCPILYGTRKAPPPDARLPVLNFSFVCSRSSHRALLQMHGGTV